jgi:hypothetical protein
VSIHPFVCLSKQDSLVPTGRIFIKNDVWVYFENLLRKFKFGWNLTRIMGVLLEDICAFLMQCYWIIRRVRNVSDKSRGNQNTHCTFIIFSQNWCLLWNTVEMYGRAIQVAGDSVIWCMHFECFITKATNTHSRYVIFIAFPQQQWFHICTSTLHLYIHCLPRQMLFGSNIILICWLHLHAIFPTQSMCTGGMEILFNRINNFHFLPKSLWLFYQELQGMYHMNTKKCVLYSVFQKNTEL